MKRQGAPVKQLGRRERDALELAAERGSVRSAELAAVKGISLSSASHVLERLAQRGLMRRGPVYVVNRRSRFSYSVAGAALDPDGD